MEGDMINVRIEALDIEKEKLKLSMKPSIEKVRSDWYSGLISSIDTRGVGVAVVLQNGDYETGFLPISQMSDSFAQDFNFNTRALVIGQEVKVRLLSFQSGTITLSMREASSKSPSRSSPPPDLSVFAKISPDKWILGCVARVARTGLVITLQLHGVQADALLRRANVAWGPSHLSRESAVRSSDNMPQLSCCRACHEIIAFVGDRVGMMHIVSHHQGYWRIQ